MLRIVILSGITMLKKSLFLSREYLNYLSWILSCRFILQCKLFSLVSVFSNCEKTLTACRELILEGTSQ